MPFCCLVDFVYKVLMSKRKHIVFFGLFCFAVLCFVYQVQIESFLLHKQSLIDFACDSEGEALVVFLSHCNNIHCTIINNIILIFSVLQFVAGKYGREVLVYVYDDEKTTKDIMLELQLGMHVLMCIRK